MARALFLGLLLLVLAIPASAQWEASQRAEFMQSCLVSCRSDPRLPAARRGDCNAACRCIADEGSRYMTPADYDYLNEGGLDDPANQIVPLYRQTIAACNRRHLGL